MKGGGEEREEEKRKTIGSFAKVSACGAHRPTCQCQGPCLAVANDGSGPDAATLSVCALCVAMVT